MSENPEKKKESTFRDWLQLVRFPAVFTSMSDIFLGFLITHLSFHPTKHFFLLLGSSSCLYLAGMLFNDVFDREVDAKERPNRPIPSGRISLKSAIGFGIFLLVAGMGLAVLNDFSQTEKTFQSSLIASLLIVAIFAYDGLLKKTILGPVVMGSCRFLNVMLGASAAATLWVNPQVYLAGCLGLYILGLTWFARNESRENLKEELYLPVVVINAGLIGLLLFTARSINPQVANAMAPLAGAELGVSTSKGISLFLCLMIVVINRRLIQVLRNPIPKNIQQAVKSMLMSYIFLNSTLILYQTGNVVYAFITVLLIFPATFLSRRIFVT